MEQVGRDLPHPSPEQVRLIILPFPLPVQQVSQGEAWERTDAFTSQPTQRQAYSFLPQRSNKMFVKHFIGFVLGWDFFPPTKDGVFPVPFCLELEGLGLGSPLNLCMTLGQFVYLSPCISSVKWVH